jgi:hypothetical protein
LTSGEIKATAINEPVQALNAMVDLAAEQIPWLFSGLVVKRSYLDANRALLVRFLKATIEGNYLALCDEARAKDVLAKEPRPRMQRSSPSNEFRTADASERRADTAWCREHHRAVSRRREPRGRRLRGREHPRRPETGRVLRQSRAEIRQALTSQDGLTPVLRQFSDSDFSPTRNLCI